jgi:hypothetical protein
MKPSVMRSHFLLVVYQPLCPPKFGKSPKRTRYACYDFRPRYLQKTVMGRGRISTTIAIHRTRTMLAGHRAMRGMPTLPCKCRLSSALRPRATSRCHMYGVRRAMNEWSRSIKNLSWCEPTSLPRWTTSAFTCESTIYFQREHVYELNTG